MYQRMEERRRVKGRVTVEEGIVYDVTARAEDGYVAVHAEYSDATADNYRDVDDVIGTGPVEDNYEGVFPFIGRLTEDDLDSCLHQVRNYDTEQKLAEHIKFLERLEPDLATDRPDPSYHGH